MFGKKILLASFLVIAMTIIIGGANATPDQAIVGSWCLDVSRNGVTRPAVLNFSADGNMTTIPGTPFPSPSLPDSTDRTAGIGEITKVGPGEWEANFQIFFTKFDPNNAGSNYNGRQVIRLPVVIASDDTISDGGNGFSITMVNKNDTVLTTISGTYTGRRIDLSSGKLCNFNISPPIP